MRGGINFQVNRLFIDSGVFTPGVSKHQLKKLAREKCARNWHDIGKHLTITSYDTAETYKNVWHSFAQWAKGNAGLRKIEKIGADQIHAYLESRIENGIRWATFQKEASALQKLEVALNLYSNKFNTGTTYAFSLAIKETSKVAAIELEREIHATRAYSDPVTLVNDLANIAYRIKACLQLEGGARISETFLKPNQMKGIDEMGFGVITLVAYNTKGGLRRDIRINADTYELLKRHMQDHGIFNVNDKSYGDALHHAAKATGQKGTGSHGFRWNFAQRRMNDLQVGGLTYEHSLSIVSHEMGHSRPDITERYLK